jgi:predicted RNA-binding Zn-ribbon protein involved in translation (DUF1610 family)
MSEQLYLCRSCRHEFKAENRPGIYACPRCGSIETTKYDTSSIFSFLASKLSSGGG